MRQSVRCRWLVMVLGIFTLVPALAACGGATSNPDVGQLVGVVYTRGGMYAETDPAEAKLTATPKSGDTSQTYTTDTAGDGSFSLDLPPGTYTLTGTLTTRGQTTPQEVTITAGETTRVEVYAIHP